MHEDREGFYETVEARDAIFLGALLAILQAMDGMLTTMGVTRFGSAVEGNPVLRGLIELYGCYPTVALLKILAIIGIVLLTISAKTIPWLRNVMEGICCFYLIAAIIPWTYILFLKPFFQI